MHKMQQQLSDLRLADNKNPHLLHQIAVLEDLLKTEKEKKEKAFTERDELRQQITKLDQELSITLHSKAPKVSYFLLKIYNATFSNKVHVTEKQFYLWG
jgi:RNA polymerase-interacting CarD/CdnL/TRCF family regulator